MEPIGPQPERPFLTPVSRVTLLPAGALVAATLLLAALPGRALAQADLYPDAVPALPPTPGAGPVPDLSPVAGQLPAPRRGQSCAAGPVARPLPGVDARGTTRAAPNPLRGQRWFVDPREPAWSSYLTLLRHRQRRRATLMWRLAREPRFKWFGRWKGPDTRAKVRSYIACAGASSPGRYR